MPNLKMPAVIVADWLDDRGRRDSLRLLHEEAGCAKPAAPMNGEEGECSSFLVHGGLCSPTCLAGYEVSRGATVCSYGTLSTATCEPSGDISPWRQISCSIADKPPFTGCSKPDAPINGNVGSCTSRILHGGSCLPSCLPGYDVVGSTTCSFGTLALATCKPRGIHHVI